MALKEDDLLLCTVEKVTPTIIFVRLPDKKQATIISSEIAPGRIKNMRQYVVPHKKIVCKILRINRDHVELSLRRVNSKEKKEVMQRYKQEQTSKSAIHSILKDKAIKTEEKILKDFPSLFDFLAEAREKEELIKKYIPKEFQEAIKKITKKKQKHVEINYTIKLKCLKDDGIKKIKEIFSVNKDNVTIIYISAGEFKFKLTAKDYKEGKKNLQLILGEIEKKSKKYSCDFSYEEIKLK